MRIFKFLLLSSIIVLLPRNSSADIIFTNTFDEGRYDLIYRQYQNKQCSQNSDYLNNSLFKFVTFPVRSGRLAMQHHIKNCDERSEVGIDHSFFEKDREYWIGWSYFIPKDFIKPVMGEPDYTLIQQMGYKAAYLDQQNGVALFECNRKSIADGKLKRTSGAPGSHMSISPRGDTFNYTITFYKGMDLEGRYIFGCKNFSIPARLNEWEDFVMNVKPSSDSEQGFVKIWKNGKLYINERVPLLRPGVNSMAAWKIGAYVGDPGHGERLLYTDELRVGNANSSFEAVSPGDY
ncbi:MAG: heparin lyase I family protein [Xenococcaceae cyanobacterium MO_188.B32]|nr:heparin lyase I family protein [Xenococcaceae cyanobacterium MO_188.B32]